MRSQITSPSAARNERRCIPRYAETLLGLISMLRDCETGVCGISLVTKFNDIRNIRRSQTRFVAKRFAEIGIDRSPRGITARLTTRPRIRMRCAAFPPSKEDEHFSNSTVDSNNGAVRNRTNIVVGGRRPRARLSCAPSANTPRRALLLIKRSTRNK